MPERWDLSGTGGELAFGIWLNASNKHVKVGTKRGTDHFDNGQQWFCLSRVCLMVAL